MNVLTLATKTHCIRTLYGITGTCIASACLAIMCRTSYGITGICLHRVCYLRFGHDLKSNDAESNGAEGNITAYGCFAHSALITYMLNSSDLVI